MRISIYSLLCAAIFFATPVAAQPDGESERTAGPDMALERGLSLLESDDPNDWENAIGLLAQAASQGAPVYLLIADSWRQGFGVDADPYEAAKWYKIGAETGDGLAQFELGRMYLHGDEIESDMVQAVFYLQLSVDRLQDPMLKRRAESALTRAKLWAGWDDWQKAKAMLKDWKPKSLTELIN